MRSSAAAAPPLRGGVRKRRSAQAPASSGKRSAEAAKRTFVLIPTSGKRALIRFLSLSARSEQALERGEGARARLGIAEQPPMVMHDERDAEKLEHQLLGIGVARELPFVERLPYRALQRLDPGALARGERIAHRPGLVVKFGGAADHRAAAGQLGRLGPVEPVAEHGAKARHAARLGERWL